MVLASIPGGVTGFFSDIYIPETFPGGKGGWCVRLTSPPSCAECHGNLGA